MKHDNQAPGENFGHQISAAHWDHEPGDWSADLRSGVIRRTGNCNAPDRRSALQFMCKWSFGFLSAFLLMAGATSAVLAPHSYGQSSPPSAPASAPQPLRTPDVPYGPTPPEAVEKLLALAEIKPGDVLYDLGCGDGRIVVAVAKKYGIKAVGVDIDPQRVKESLANVKTNQVENLVTVVEGDLFATDFSQATVVALFLGNDMNVKLMPQLRKLKPGTRILSFEFHMRGARPNEVLCGTRLEDGHEYTIYKWVVPWEPE